MPSPQARSVTPQARPSTAARVLEPLVSVLWILFLLWTAVVAATWFFNLGEAQLSGWFSQKNQATGEIVLRYADLYGALRAVLANADVIWLTLGMVNGYLALVRRVGLATARTWSLLIFAVSWGAAALSVWTSLPMGAFRFTTRLGFKVGPVSIGWILLWFCCVVGAREFVRALAGRASHTKCAIMTGALLGVVSIPLELVGWKVRAWWLWYPGNVAAHAFPPASSYLTWALLGALLSLAMQERTTVESSREALGRATVVFVCIVALLGIALGTAIA